MGPWICLARAQVHRQRMGPSVRLVPTAPCEKTTDELPARSKASAGNAHGSAFIDCPLPTKTPIEVKVRCHTHHVLHAFKPCLSWIHAHMYLRQCSCPCPVHAMYMLMLMSMSMLRRLRRSAFTPINRWLWPAHARVAFRSLAVRARPLPHLLALSRTLACAHAGD